MSIIPVVIKNKSNIDKVIKVEFGYFFSQAPFHLEDQINTE